MGGRFRAVAGVSVAVVAGRRAGRDVLIGYIAPHGETKVT
jgi:hypothetical protein